MFSFVVTPGAIRNDTKQPYNIMTWRNIRAQHLLHTFQRGKNHKELSPGLPAAGVSDEVLQAVTKFKGLRQLLRLDRSIIQLKLSVEMQLEHLYKRICFSFIRAILVHYYCNCAFFFINSII
jgi:hypothetical protein